MDESGEPQGGRGDGSKNKIRPFPEKLLETVKSIGMCAKDWKCEGTECTYAHSWQERCSWNARLKRKFCVTLTEEGRKKPKLDSASSSFDVTTLAEAESEADSAESEADSAESSVFIDTKVYKELVACIKKWTPRKKGILLLGPKGLGKTMALKQLSRTNKSLYVDLLVDSFPTTKKSNILLLDNAQLLDYTQEQNSLIRKHDTVIAAFSPGADIDKKVKRLGKACGDGQSLKFYWRPFTLDDTMKLCKLVNSSLCESDTVDVHERCAGNPRYILDDADGGSPSIQEVKDQFKELICKDVQKQLGKTAKEICREIVATFSSGESYGWNLIEQLGCFYCTNWDGTGTWKVANLYYVFSAVKFIGGADFLAGERWQQLECATALVLSCGNVMATGLHDSIEISKSTKVKIQPRIGKRIKPHDWAVTMLKLASGHNLIDVIVYDLRATPVKIYFIQTSLSEYSKHSKGLIEVPHSEVKKGRETISKVSCLHHYSTNLSRKAEYYYIYATTSMPKQYPKDIYFLNLAKYLPHL